MRRDAVEHGKTVREAILRLRRRFWKIRSPVRKMRRNLERENRKTRILRGTRDGQIYGVLPEGLPEFPVTPSVIGRRRFRTGIFRLSRTFPRKPWHRNRRTCRNRRTSPVRLFSRFRRYWRDRSNIRAIRDGRTERKLSNTRRNTLFSKGFPRALTTCRRPFRQPARKRGRRFGNPFSRRMPRAGCPFGPIPASFRWPERTPRSPSNARMP